MKLYDNALPAYDELASYYPVWYPDVLEMNAILRAQGTEIDALRAALLKVVDANYVLRCDEATLRRYEEFLRVTPEPTKPLSDRRAVVAALMRGFGHIGEREILDFVGMFTTGGIEVRFSRGGVIDVIITRDVKDKANISDVYYVLGKRIPAHLSLVVHDNILPVTVTTVEKVWLYSIAAVEETFFDGTYTFNGAIDFSGWHLKSIEYEVNHMASTITNTRMALLAAASRGEGALPAITHVAFGSGGADTQGRPIEPDPAQTALVNELARYPIDEATSPQANVSRFSATIPVDELSGEQISEAGLIDAAGNLVAVKNMPSKTKEDGVKLVYSIDDIFVRGQQ